jgi:hypothetical protein
MIILAPELLNTLLIIIIALSYWWIYLFVRFLLFLISSRENPKPKNDLKCFLNFIESLLFIPIYRYWYVQRNKENKSKEDHIALILTNRWSPGRLGQLMYILDTYTINIRKLVKHLKENKIPYRVYDKVAAEDVKNIIINPKTYLVILIGHGTKHGIATGRNEKLYYCELAEAPQKKVIQFHCNCYGGNSLSYYIAKSPKEQYSIVKDGKLTDCVINEQIDDLIKNKKFLMNHK